MKDRTFSLMFLFSLAALLTAATFTTAVTPAAQERIKKEAETIRQEQREDYFRKWLKEDAFYIITEEEKSVFEKLTAPQEKERFIEQFWYRPRLFMGHVDKGFQPGVFVRSEPGFS